MTLYEIRLESLVSRRLGATCRLDRRHGAGGHRSPSRLTSAPTEVGYPCTNYLSTCFGFGAVAICFALSALLGYAFRQRWSVALGMMLPWPIACVLEIKRNPPSHNMFPFEAVVILLPAFLLAFLGATAAQELASRIGRANKPS
jgi:hypothetical protein